MPRQILEDVIQNFDINKFTSFFRSKTELQGNFRPSEESLSQYNDDNFIDFQKIGQIEFSEDKVLITAAKVNNELSERAGKKNQYEKAKKILRELQNYSAGIFIYYDNKNNFRFSLIHPEYLGNHINWSNFQRFTYFVNKEFTNKTYLQRIGEGDFSSLEKIKDAFSVEKVTEAFYSEIANWYFWAVKNSTFPKDAEMEVNGRNMAIIRLITRLIFIWFMRERGLVPKILFDKSEIIHLLNNLNPQETTYYKAILQNLFFATLNTKNKDRKYRFQNSFQGINKNYMDHSIYRYESYFKDKNTMLIIFRDIPYLNGGLFDCLDKLSKNNVSQSEIRIDGFTDKEVGLKIPNFLFFSDTVEVDLNKEFGTSNKKFRVKGMLDILTSYNFTVDENDHNDQEVALDPELLGKVFENLLASFNPETASTARKATGSYYTPREIVDYMVTESLKNYFRTSLDVDKIDEMLNNLFSSESKENPFSHQATLKLIELINDLRVLDPAVGSGAFLMGVLNKLVFILTKLDPDNTHWKNAQVKAIEIGIIDPLLKKQLIDQIVEKFTYKNLDYGRKLFLIQKCIYGVDIQQIAVEISKLRFFISLLVDEKIDKNKENWGIESLPNLDYKIMQGNSLLEVYKGIKLFDERLLNVKLPDEKEINDIDKKIKDIDRKLMIYYQKNPRWMKNPKLERPQELIILESEVNRIKLSRKDLLKFNQENLNSENQAQLKIETDEEQSQAVWLLLQNLHKKLFVPSLTKDEKEKIKQEIDKLEWRLIEATLREQNEVEDLEKIERMENSNTKPFFLWHLYYPEVFEEKGGFDIIIGNPPYIRVQEIDKKLSEEYKHLYRSATGSFDLYLIFAEKSLGLINNKGIVNFIMPHKWINSAYGRGLREITKNKISKLISFKEYQVFNASTYTSLIWFKFSNDNFIYVGLNKNLESNSDLAEFLNSMDKNDPIVVKNTKLSSGVWNFNEYKISKILQKISSQPLTVKDVFDKIFQGLKTGSDEVFILHNCIEQENLLRGYSKALEREVEIEKGLSRPLLKGNNIHRYETLKTDKVVVFPYGLSVEGNKTKATLLVESYLRSKFPYGYKYLKRYENVLRDREHKKFNIDGEWFQFSRNQGMIGVNGEKIILSELSLGSNMTIDTNNLYHVGQYSMVKKNRVKESYKFYLAILNSKLMWFFIKNTGSILRGGYFAFRPDYLNPFPLPIVENESNIKHIEALVEKVIEVKNINSSSDTSNIEAEIDRQVYKLYCLTPEEIEIVEKKDSI